MLYPGAMLDTDKTDSMTHLLPLVGAMMVVPVWIVVDGVLPPVLPGLPQGTEIGLVLAGLALILGVAWVGACLTWLLRRVRTLSQTLEIRDAEISEGRTRLRRCLADLDRFGDIAAHDLQEPLRRIVSYAQLLEEHRSAVEDDDTRFYLSQVITESRRMRSLIGGLLAVTGPDRSEAHPVPVAAQAALVQARGRLSTALSMAGATVVVDRLPPVMGDETALVEIFAQLIDNALRYRSAERRLVIRVSAERRGDRIALLVGDNGIGIDPAKVARMFEPFYRALPTACDAAEPAGTGLAVVRRLAERLGGRVWVESKPGEGSIFGVSLPAVTA